MAGLREGANRHSLAQWFVSIVLRRRHGTRRRRRPNPKGCAAFGRVLCCSSVADYSGCCPFIRRSGSVRRASRQNPQQRCYPSYGGGALGAGLAPERSRVSLVPIDCAERPEVSGVSIAPYGSVIGRLLRNLVRVHRSLVIPPKRICDIPGEETSCTNLTMVPAMR